MMYHHHGLQMAFTGNYNEYFGMDTDVDAVVYLMLANDMMHSFFPHCVTIAIEAWTAKPLNPMPRYRNRYTYNRNPRP